MGDINATMLDLCVKPTEVIPARAGSGDSKPTTKLERHLKKKGFTLGHLHVAYERCAIPLGLQIQTATTFYDETVAILRRLQRPPDPYQQRRTLRVQTQVVMQHAYSVKITAEGVKASVVRDRAKLKDASKDEIKKMILGAIKERDAVEGNIADLEEDLMKLRNAMDSFCLGRRVDYHLDCLRDRSCSFARY